jgi:hypothetical protein
MENPRGDATGVFAGAFEGPTLTLVLPAKAVLAAQSPATTDRWSD